jgi:hypothetical protein
MTWYNFTSVSNESTASIFRADSKGEYRERITGHLYVPLFVKPFQWNLILHSDLRIAMDFYEIL